MSPLTNMPPELLLATIHLIPYHPLTLLDLKHATPTFYQLVDENERSISKGIRAAQFSARVLGFFPVLGPTYSDLETLHWRLGTMNAIQRRCSKIANKDPECSWLDGRWENIDRAGMILIYRLTDVPKYSAKVAYLNSLPATSLACMMLKLTASLYFLRAHGPEPFHERFADGYPEMRSDIELSLEEMLLFHGPGLYLELLQAAELSKDAAKLNHAVHTVQIEIDNIEERQLDLKQPPTLLCCLRKAFAAKLNVDVHRVAPAMWRTLNTTCFDRVNGDGGFMAKILEGQEVVGGLKRIF